jgi:hypothetical protein
MGVIDDIASRLNPTHTEAAQTDALTLFGLMLATPATGPGTHRPGPVRSGPRPWRRDGHEAAEQPGMTASQTTRTFQRRPRSRQPT